MWAVAEIFYAYFDLIAGVDAPSPSLADALWLPAYIMLFLLGVFMLALSVNIYRGVEFSCGCFGLDGGGGTLMGAVIKDLLLVLVVSLLLFVDELPYSVDTLF